MEGFKVARTEGGRFWSAIVREGQTLGGVRLLLEYRVGHRIRAPAGTAGVTLFDSLAAALAFLPSVVGEAAVLRGEVEPFSVEEEKARRQLLGRLYSTKLTEEGLMKVTMAPKVTPGNVFTAPGTVLAASFLPVAVVELRELPLAHLEEV